MTLLNKKIIFVQILFLTLILLIKGSKNVKNNQLRSTQMHIKNMLTTSTWTSALLSFSTLYPSMALAKGRKGAFEMDMEYYITDLTLGLAGKKDKPKPQRAKVNKGRRLDEKFAENVYHIAINKISLISGQSIDKIKEAAKLELHLYKPYFEEFVTISEETFKDARYFDISIYALFRVAEKIIASSEERIRLRRLIGQSILDSIKEESGVLPLMEAIKSESTTTTGTTGTTGTTKGDPSIMPLIAQGSRRLLNTLRVKGFCGNFILGDDDMLDPIYINNSFSDNLAISFQLTLVDPVTIISHLEFAQANTFFHPELLASVVQAWVSQWFVCNFEDYLMDNEYRTSNFDVQAQDVIVEMIVRQKS